MTEPRPPLDRALEMLVYLPVGAALAAAEELPRLADKGRERVTGQVAMARLLGQLAVSKGQEQAERRVRQAAGILAGPLRAAGWMGSEPDPAPTPASPAPAPAAGGTGAAAGGSAGSFAGATPPAAPPPVHREDLVAAAAAELVVEPEPEAEAGAGAPGGRDLGTAPADGGPGMVTGNGIAPSPPGPDLAIPGYDALSASQVVQRLAGLTAEELEAVRAYEVGIRSRKTILNRISQLQAGTG